MKSSSRSVFWFSRWLISSRRPSFLRSTSRDDSSYSFHASSRLRLKLPELRAEGQVLSGRLGALRASLLGFLDLCVQFLQVGLERSCVDLPPIGRACPSRRRTTRRSSRQCGRAMRCISLAICPSQRWRMSASHETGAGFIARNIEKPPALGVVEFVAAVGRCRRRASNPLSRRRSAPPSCKAASLPCRQGFR